MVQNVNPTFVKTPNAQITSFTTTAGAGGAFQTIYTGGTNGSKVVGISITSNATASQDVRIAVVGGGVQAYINTVTVTLNSGFSGSVPPTNGLLGAALPIDSDGNAYALLPSTAYSLSAQITTLSSIWSTGLAIGITVTAGDF